MQVDHHLLHESALWKPRIYINIFTDPFGNEVGMFLTVENQQIDIE
jgi:hypothetical protein